MDEVENRGSVRQGMTVAKGQRAGSLYRGCEETHRMRDTPVGGRGKCSEERVAAPVVAWGDLARRYDPECAMLFISLLAPTSNMALSYLSVISCRMLLPLLYPFLPLLVYVLPDVPAPPQLSLQRPIQLNATPSGTK